MHWILKNILFGAPLFFLISAFAAGPDVNGETSALEHLTLADAKRLAFERNWDLLAARSSLDSATAQLLVVKEFPNPNASAATARIGESENGTPVGNGIWARNYDTIFAVNQLIEIGGKRRDRQGAARAGILGAKARFLDAKRLLDQGVTKAYAAALLTGENERILRESAGYMQHERQIAETRFNAGDLADSDLKQIQVAAGQYDLQVKAAEAASTQARIAVEILLGINRPQGNWHPADTLDQACRAPEPKSGWQTNALRPDVLAAQMDLRAAAENLKLQKAERIPDPTVSLQFEHNPPGGGPPTDTVGFGVSFPLPIWNLNKGNIDAARASVDQSNLALAKLRAQMDGDLISAEAAHDEAAERLKNYQDHIRPQADSARASVIFKFDKGGATLVDLLEAERSDNDVRIATAQAMADTVSTAADLSAAQTTLTETDLSSVK
jgi:cobalt-zinc-cadmium efflux system outer membrane protein